LSYARGLLKKSTFDCAADPAAPLPPDQIIREHGPKEPGATQDEEICDLLKLVQGLPCRATRHKRSLNKLSKIGL